MPIPSATLTVRGPAGGMQSTPGAAKPHEVEFAANVDVGGGAWERRPGFVPFPGPAYGLNQHLFGRDAYIDVIAQAQPSSGPSFMYALGETLDTTPGYVGYSVPRLLYLGRTVVGGAVVLTWQPYTLPAGLARVSAPGQWSVAETMRDEVVVATSAGDLLVVTNEAGAPHVGRLRLVDGAFVDAYAYLKGPMRAKLVRWWQNRLILMHDPRWAGGSRLIVVSDMGGGSGLRKPGQFSVTAASNISIPTNEQDPIIASGEAGEKLIVLCEKSAWALGGSGARVMGSTDFYLRRLPGAGGAVSSLGGVSVPRPTSDGWAWVGRDGVWMTNGETAARVSGGLDRWWKRNVSVAGLRAARARVVVTKNRADFLVPLKGRGPTSAGLRMCLISWHYDRDAWVIRGMAFPGYSATTAKGYVNATALGTMWCGGVEYPIHATSDVRRAGLGASVAASYLDDVGHRDAGVAADRPQMKVLTPRYGYGDGHSKRVRSVVVTANEVGYGAAAGEVGLRIGAIVNPLNLFDYDDLPTPAGEVALLHQGSTRWDDVTWDGGLWEPDREVTKQGDTPDATGEHFQILFDASETEYLRLGGWEVEYQNLGRKVNARDDVSG